MSLISTVTLSCSVSPALAPRSADAVGDAGRQQPRQRLALLLARHDRRVQMRFSRSSAPAVPADTPSASRTNRLSTRASTAAGVECVAAAIALIGLPSATISSRASSSASRPPVRRTGLISALTIDRIEHRPAGGHLADRPGQLVALGDAVLQQVGVAGGALRQQRDRVVGIVVLAEDHDAGAGMALADQLAGVDAFASGSWAACGCR